EEIIVNWMEAHFIQGSKAFTSKLGEEVGKERNCL
ncbi:alpha/beta hydrolase, partial [Bacillus thuringiensis]|nr:alpha/beta hydrolase [Bacillus thuringiensis]